MATDRSLVPTHPIAQTILILRRQRVILDADLAALFGVPTKALNQAVKRNRARFPADFMFRLTKAEKTEVVTNCDRLSSLRFSATLPHAFTEHGAIMAANVLNSDRAIRMSVEVARAFVRLRRLLSSQSRLARRLRSLERKYDSQFKIVFDAIRALMEPPDDEPARSRIGFRAD